MSTLFFSDTEVNDLSTPCDETSAESEIYIFGAGNTGRDFLERIRNSGRCISGFLDNNPALLGSVIDGYRVFSPHDLTKTNQQAVIVAAAAGTPEILQQCRDLGLVNALSMNEFVRRQGCEIELRTLSDNAPAVECAGLWADDASRETYRALIRYRITLDPRELPAAHPDHYFAPEVVRPEDLRSFADCGAFWGDTFLGYRARVGDNFDNYYAFEACGRNFARLMNTVDEDTRIRLYNIALWSSPGTMKFLSESGPLSRLSEHGTVDASVDTLDRLLADEPVTMIKMDVEGAEPAILEGAKSLLHGLRPVLAISVYHRVDHLWRIPLWIAQQGLEYRLMLRHHHPDHHGETVCYAIPG